MASNQFIVDLGSLDLTTEQRKNMNAVIQGAVTNELARFKLNKRIVLIPVDRWPKGPILDGIIARPLDKNIGKNLSDLIK